MTSVGVSASPGPSTVHAYADPTEEIADAGLQKPQTLKLAREQGWRELGAHLVSVNSNSAAASSHR